jgi:hypothetical protein
MYINVDINASGGGGTQCIGATGPITCVAGTQTKLVVIANAPSTSPPSICSDGKEHDYKAIIFCGGTARQVHCVSSADLPLLRSWTIGLQASFDLVSTVPQAVAEAISCPPPMLTAEAERQRLAILTSWMRTGYSSSPVTDSALRDAG